MNGPCWKPNSTKNTNTKPAGSPMTKRKITTLTTGLGAVITALQEFVEDVEFRYSTETFPEDVLAREWSDLAVTYNHARQALNTLFGE